MKPSQHWYGLAAAVFILGAVIVALFVAQAVSSFPAPVAELRSVETQTVRLEREGLTILTKDPEVAGRCLVINADGEEVQLSPPSISETVNDWHVRLRSVRAVPPGSYDVQCQAGEAQAALFGVGPHASVMGFIVNIFVAIGLTLLTIMVTALIALITFGKRQGHRQRLRAQAVGHGPPGY